MFADAAINLTPGSTTVAEGGSQTVTVSLSEAPVPGSPSDPSDVNLTIIAEDPARVTITPGTIQYNDTDWQSDKSFTIQVADDSTHNTDNSISVVVTASSQTQYNTSATFALTITDDDPVPTPTTTDPPEADEPATTATTTDDEEDTPEDEAAADDAVLNAYSETADDTELATTGDTFGQDQTRPISVKRSLGLWWILIVLVIVAAAGTGGWFLARRFGLFARFSKKHTPPAPEPQQKPAPAKPSAPRPAPTPPRPPASQNAQHLQHRLRKPINL